MFEHDHGSYVIGIDTETALMRPGLRVPPMTCMSLYDKQTRRGDVVDRHKARQLMAEWLRDDRVLLVLHNAPYDIAVMANEWPELLPWFFYKYERDLIEDTLITEQLIDIAKGLFRWKVDEETDEVSRKKYGLGDLFPGMDKDTYRTGYGPLRDVPVEHWPPGYYDYALGDAVKAVELRDDQHVRFGGPVPFRFHAARTAFALHLMGAWGMRTDPALVAWLEPTLDEHFRRLTDELLGTGLVRPKGSEFSQNMELTRNAIKASGIPITLTDGGNVSTSSDVLRMAALHEPALLLLLKWKEAKKLKGTYMPVLKQGLEFPIMANWNALVSSGRTSCWGPALQTLPRGNAKDPHDLARYIREAFVPRPGMVFNSTDYDTLELRTLAQQLYDLVGGTTLLREYERDPDFDPHTRLASMMLGISYDEGMRRKNAKDGELGDRRQMSKPGNFGYAGGMGWRKMIEYALKSYNVVLTPTMSQQLRRFYLASIPEMKPYFALNSQITSVPGGRGAVQYSSGMFRGGMFYTDCCNGWFQHAAAVGATQALWDVTKACYAQTHSPLFGSRPTAFVHDEIITEMPVEAAHEASIEKQRIMVESMQAKSTPMIPIRASPALMERWYKGADSVYDSNKRLVPYRPKQKAA